MELLYNKIVIRFKISDLFVQLLIKHIIINII